MVTFFNIRNPFISMEIINSWIRRFWFTISSHFFKSFSLNFPNFSNFMGSSFWTIAMEFLFPSSTTINFCFYFSIIWHKIHSSTSSCPIIFIAFLLMLEISFGNSIISCLFLQTNIKFHLILFIVIHRVIHSYMIVYWISFFLIRCCICC